jgi:hypothetical protein
VHPGAGAVDQIEPAVLVGADVVRLDGVLPPAIPDEAADLLGRSTSLTSTARRPALK